jgi:hypothetical protein
MLITRGYDISHERSQGIDIDNLNEFLTQLLEAHEQIYQMTFAL